VLDAYSVVFAALLIPAGRIADLIGRRRVFLAGLGLFMLGSSLCAAAPSLQTLIAARVLQAAGAAAMVPTSLALLLPEFPAARRATAVGLWAASAGIASASGPVLAGLLIRWQGWPAIFLINLPIGAGAIIAGRLILGEARAPKPPALPDFAGAVMLGAAIALIALAIVQSPAWGWTSARSLAVDGAALVLLALFAARSARHAAPVIAPELLRIRSFLVANTGSLLFSVAFFAWLLCGVLYLTGAWHYSPLTAGLAITPAPIGSAIASVAAGRIADRRGHRAVAAPAALMFAAGAALIAAGASSHPQFLSHWLPGAILAGTGVGAGMTALAGAAAASLPAHALGAGGAINITARQIGAVLGVAILVAIIGTPASTHTVTTFQAGWSFSALATTAAGAIALSLGRAGPASQTTATPEPGASTRSAAGEPARATP
jgi:EmrB/QacA subfamily drug resistance transporter